MKSIKTSIYTLILAGIGLWSCNDDSLAPSATIQGGESTPVDITFSASMGATISKSTVSATTGETKFSSDDRIKVFTNDGKNAEFACAGISDNGKEAQFSGTLSKASGYYALLPYQANATASGNTLTVNLPAEQTSNYEELMVGYTTNNNAAFQFRHVGAMIRFITQKKFSSIEIEDVKGNKIAGDISVKISSDGKITEVAGGTSSKVSISRDIQAADAVLITIKPCTIEANELRIKFTDKSRGTFTHIIDKATTFKSGVIYSYGNVGQYLITIKEPGTDKTLSTMYAADYETTSSELRGRAELPTIPAESGYIYGYHTNPNATTPRYTTTISGITTHTTLYAIKTKAINVTIYNNGANSTPIKTVAFPSSNIILPAITLQPKDGYVYGYATTANGKPTIQPGTNYATGTQDITFYAVETPAYVANIYGNGASQPITETYSGIEGFSFTLPTLTAKSGQFGGYSTTANDTEIKYYQGQSFIYDTQNFKQNPTNFYPVYRESVAVTKTNNISLAGTTVGSGYTQQTAMQSPLPKVEKGTCSVFKFTNHCNASAPTSQNVSILLLDKDDVNSPSTLYKTFYLGQKSSGQAEYQLNSNNLMANSNNTEITVKVYNKGGIADIEISWTGTVDAKSNLAKYSNISIWDNLYVSFGVNKSYIELK